MRYSILGFNQEKAVEAGLDLTDLLILQYIEQACASPKMKHILNDNDEPLVWISHIKFHNDMPILNIAESTLKNRLSNLKKKGFIQSETINNSGSNGSNTFYGFTERTQELLYSDIEQSIDVPPEVRGSSKPRTARSTSDSKLNINNRLIDTNTNVLVEERPKKKNLYSKCSDYIVQYTNNIPLQDALHRFLDLRLEIAKNEGKPFYYNMWPSIVKDLDKYDIDMAIKVVEQSIQKGWKRFYEIKDYSQKSSIKSADYEKNVGSDKHKKLDLTDEVY